jgi:hypothetical protein
MSQGELLLELEAAGWIGRHYAGAFIWLEPGVFVYGDEWAHERASMIGDLLLSPAASPPEPATEPLAPKPITKLEPSKTIKHKAKPWKLTLSYNRS